MAKLKNVDKPCEVCGVLMVDVTPMRRFCKTCADKRNKANKARCAAERSRKNMCRAQTPAIPNPNSQYCKGCRYWDGNSGCHCCNYIFIEGHRRPCPPGKECTVRKAKKRKETE